MIERGRRWNCGLLVAAGILGAAGVALGAASAHLGGGDLARLAAFLLLFHAAAIPGLLGAPHVPPRIGSIAATLLAIGAACFSGDVAVLAFTGATPLSGLAPLGGVLLIAGWILLALGAAMAFARGASVPP